MKEKRNIYIYRERRPNTVNKIKRKERHEEMQRKEKINK